MRAVDASDMAQRNSDSNIEDAYHEHWLSRCQDGIYEFHAPEFYLTKGVARFVNGRHRTLVLTQHLAEMPMALTSMDGYPLWAKQPSRISLQVLGVMSVRKVGEEEVFLFPDLPIRYLGYDDNIGK